MEILVGMRQLEYAEDKEKYLAEKAPIDAMAIAYIIAGREEEALELIKDDKVFMKAITISNRIYELATKESE